MVLDLAVARDRLANAILWILIPIVLAAVANEDAWEHSQIVPLKMSKTTIAMALFF